MLEVGGILPYVRGLGGIYTSVKLWCLVVHPLGVHYTLSCIFFVVHFVSHIYHDYNYYSSSYGGVFWCIIYFISGHGPFLMGFPATSGQHEVVLLPFLMVRGSGGVIGPPSSMPLLIYANYAMGSPQVSFFFRVEAATILYIICLVSILVSAFYFQVPSHAIFPYGGSIVRVCTIPTLYSLPMAGICPTWGWSSVHTWYA